MIVIEKSIRINQALIFVFQAGFDLEFSSMIVIVIEYVS